MTDDTTAHRTSVRPVLNPGRWRGQWAALCTCGWMQTELFRANALTAATAHRTSHDEP